MRTLRFIMVITTLVILGFSAQAISAEYYVIESRSGIVAIMDHKPEGGATILKGPFESKEAAEKALTAEEKEQLGNQGSGKGRGRGQGKGQGKGQGRNR